MFNGIRPPHEGILGESIINCASERYGFVFINDDAEVIQQNYEELYKQSQASGFSTSPTVSEGEILDFLFKSYSNEHYIEQVHDQVFFIDPMILSDKEGAKEEICDNIIEVFDECVFFTPKVLIDSFPGLPDSVADYFVEKLVEHDIIIRVCNPNYSLNCEEEVLTVSSVLADDYRVRLSNIMEEASSGGTISESELQRQICVGVSDSLIEYLEEQRLLIRINEYGDFLVPGELEDFAAELAHQIENEIDMVLRDNDFIMLEGKFNDEIQKTLVERVELQNIPSDIKEEEFLKVRVELMSQLGLKRRKINDGLDIIVSHRFDDLVSTVAEDTVTRVASDLERGDEHPPTLEGVLGDQIPDFSGDEILTDYYEEAVIEECKQYIRNSDINIYNHN